MGEPYGHRPYEHKDYDASSSDLFSESSSRERGEQTPAEYSGSEEMVRPNAETSRPVPA